MGLVYMNVYVEHVYTYTTLNFSTGTQRPHVRHYGILYSEVGSSL